MAQSEICNFGSIKSKGFLVPNSKVNATVYLIGKITSDSPTKIEVTYKRTIQFEKKGATTSTLELLTDPNKVDSVTLSKSDIAVKDLSFTFSDGTTTNPGFINIDTGTPACPLFLTNFKLYPNVPYNTATLEVPSQYLFEGEPLGISS